MATTISEYLYGFFQKKKSTLEFFYKNRPKYSIIEYAFLLL